MDESATSSLAWSPCSGIRGASARWRRARRASPVTKSSRWEAARTDRLNAHWKHAVPWPVDQSGSRQRPGHAAGLVVPTKSPIVRSWKGSSRRFASMWWDRMVRVCKCKAATPSITRKRREFGATRSPSPRTSIGNFHGADILHLWIRLMLFSKGEYLAQMVTDETATGPVQFRLLCHDPDRLATPIRGGCPGRAGRFRVNKTGRPLQYYLRDEQLVGAAACRPPSSSRCRRT